MYFEYVLDDCDQSDLFRRRVDEQRYSQTDCNVWLKSGIQKGVALASVFSHLWTDLSEARDPPPHMNPVASLMLTQALQAHESRRPFRRNRFRWEGMTWSNRTTRPPTKRTPMRILTYLVPQGHGRFALRWSRLATAAEGEDIR